MPRLCGLLPLLLLVTVAAHAYHGTTLSYYLAGYVLDADRQPIADSPVTVRLAGQNVGSARSNASGYYLAQLQLSDHDWGRDLRVIGANGEGTVRVAFDPDDTDSPHWHYVNFIDGELVEERLILRDLLGWSYGVGAVLAVIVALFVIRRVVRKRKRRQARQSTAGQPARAVSAKAARRQSRRRRR